MSEQDRVQHISEFGMRTNENDNSNVNLSKSAFEAWYDDGKNDPLPDDYTILGKRYLYLGWQAATTEANKRIAELKSEVTELKEKLKHSEYAANAEARFADKLSDQVTELQASNNTLREALMKIKYEIDMHDNYEIIVNILYSSLSATPAESLQAFENSVIEKIINIIKSETDKFNNVDSLLYIIEILDNMKVNHETTKTP